MNETDLMKLCDYLECNDASLEAQCEAAAELRRLHALCQEMLSELYVYRASEYLKDVTAAIKARNNKNA